MLAISNSQQKTPLIILLIVHCRLLNGKYQARPSTPMALGVLDKHYRNYRDQVDFLRRLIRCGGGVKMGKDREITVSLSRLNTPAENQIATAFLNEINSLDPVLLGADPIPIRFRLGA